MDWIKKHHLWIMAVLFLLFGLKSCQSCTRNHRIHVMEERYRIMVDSMGREEVIYNLRIQELKDSIIDLQYKVTGLQDRNDMLSGSLEYVRTRNETLVETMVKNKNR